MNIKRTVIVVEDDLGICDFISTILSSNGYTPLTASNGNLALSLISSHCPDVILLDLGLPDMDGLEVIHSVRGWSSVPIIVISARGQEQDKVEALDLGADDYLVKPFGSSELLARIRTALRHSDRSALDSDASVFSTGGLTVDLGRHIVTVDGEDVHLTQIEFKIVALLSKYAGRVLTYDFIIRNIWGPHGNKDNQILRVNMANIRRKLEKNTAQPQYILTEVGVGYRMPEKDAEN